MSIKPASLSLAPVGVDAVKLGVDVPLAGQISSSWEILDSDVSLQNSFERWSKSAKWKVRWEGMPLIKNNGYTKLPDGTFLDVADYVLKRLALSAKAVGMSLVVTAYPDNVLVISNERQK